MFGIDPITISSMLILTAGAQCPQRKPTEINVIPRTEKVRYDTKQTLKQIQRYSTDTVDPYGFHGQAITQAFMRGQIGLQQKIRFGTSVRGGIGCVWYDTIIVEIDITPEIVIAKELYRDACMRKAIIGHELKHVKVDRQVVNKYAKTMGAKLFQALKSRGFSAGPFRAERMPEVQAKMQRVVKQILELEYQKLGIERQERQREVDTLEEYESVDDQCPHFDKKKQKLYSTLK